MTLEHSIPKIDEILDDRRETIGTPFEGYRNHVYRMVNFTLALGTFCEAEREKIIIAGCFHDIGIWPGNNFDYLKPSVDAAREYLLRSGRSDWAEHVSQMICEHHKISRYADDPTVEAFRRGDLADFSLGLIRCGLPSSYIAAVRSAFPNKSFHLNLLRIAGRWICRHPLNPVPVIKY